MNIAVIDVGTSSMRGILYDADGRQLDVCQISYRVETPREGIVEQDPDVWTDALVRICRTLSERASAAGRTIDALSMTCQRSSIIPVDREGKPLRKAIMWQDTRNTGIVQKLLGERERIEWMTGARLNTVFSGSKMTWLRENEPELCEKTYKICTVADYLTQFMTGEYVTDETYGSRSLLMGLKSRRWEPVLLELFGIGEDKLCRILPPGSISGRIRASFAAATGLREGIALISAGGDQQCGALGQGVLAPGNVEITVGTGAFVLQQTDKPLNTWGKGIVTGAHAIPGALVMETSLLTCAALYNWASRTFFQVPGYDSINREVADVPAGSGGCICIPYFQGRGTPDWNSQARGAFLNLELGTSRGAMARSVLESIAYEIRNSLEILERCGENTGRACIGGGLVRQPQFCQILSDVTGYTLSCEKDSSEQTARGAWISAAVTLGLFEDYRSAWEKAAGGIRVETFRPNAGNRKVYEDGRKKMNQYYGCMKEERL